jgi:hypothetical protein
MPSIGFLELILIPVIALLPFAIFFIGVYWAVRLAIRHEKQKPG